MANLEQDLARASTLARLDRIIDALRRTGRVETWSADERRWFASLLLPFGGDVARCRRLSSVERTNSAPSMLLATVVQDLIAEAASADELRAILELCVELYNPDHVFGGEDDRRVLQLADAVRRCLLDEPTRAASPDVRELVA